MHCQTRCERKQPRRCFPSFPPLSRLQRTEMPHTLYRNYEKMPSDINHEMPPTLPDRGETPFSFQPPPCLVPWQRVRVRRRRSPPPPPPSETSSSASSRPQILSSTPVPAAILQHLLPRRPIPGLLQLEGAPLPRVAGAPAMSARLCHLCACLGRLGEPALRGNVRWRAARHWISNLPSPFSQ
jgi:hypothetical protein